MKIALAVDSFFGFGGEEKTSLLLAEKYGADIYTYYVSDKMKKDLSKFNIVSPDNVTTRNIIKSFFRMQYFKKLDLEGKYDAIIMVGYLGSIYAAKLNHPNVWYSFGPSRILTGSYGNTLKGRLIGFLSRQIIRNKSIVEKNIDKVVTIGEFSKINLKKLYNINPEIIHLPISTKQYYNKDSEGFYLAVGRLVTLKRFDLLVEAFKKMPDKKLIIAGGSGNQEQFLKDLAKGFDNIEIKVNVSNEEMKGLYATCIGFIYTPINYEFSQVALEALASGKPVILSNDGGTREVLNGKNGFAINPDVQSIIDAVKSLSPEKAAKMKVDCLESANDYDISVFYQKMDKVLRSLH